MNEKSYMLYKGIPLKNKLSKEEQHRYLKEASQGNYEAQQILFEHNLRLVIITMRKCFSNIDPKDEEDIFQIGSLGLWEAITKFDLSFNTELSTYAIIIIIGKIKKHLRDNNLLSISRSIQDLSYKIYLLQQEYELKNETLTSEQLSNILKVPEEEIFLAIASKQIVASLEEPIFKDNDNNEHNIYDSIDVSTPSFENEIVENIVLEQAIDSLENREKKVVKLLYGIGCGEKNQIEVAEILNLSQAQVSRINAKALSNLKKMLSEEKEIKINTNKINSNNNFFLQFSPFSKKEILNILESLDEENIKIIELYYGLNGTKQVSVNKIATQLNLEMGCINNKICEIVKQIKIELKNEKLKRQQLFDLYPGYTKEQILAVINLLSEENKQIIELYYGLNGKKSISTEEIAKQLNVETNYINNRIYSIEKQIKRRLKNKRFKIKTIFDLYPEYTENQILGTISTLPLKSRKIIELKFGLNGNKAISFENIAKQLNLEIDYIKIKFQQIKQQIKRRLEKKMFKKESIFDLYPEYSEEQILGAIDTLNSKNKKIIELKYGLNGNEFLETNQIAKYFNTTVAAINSFQWSIEKQIKRRLEKGIFKKESIFDLYPEYTKEQILGAISTLNSKNQKIIELKYGLNGRECRENPEIAKEFNIQSSEVSKTINSIQKQIEKRLERGQFKKEEIFDLFPGYTKEQILYVIDTLSVDSKKIIELRYGLNGNEAISNVELENQYNVHRASSRVYSIMIQIKERLEKSKTKDNMILNLYPGHTKEQILDIIDTLSGEKKTTLELRYGLNNNEINEIEDIAKQLNITNEDVYTILKLAKSQVKRRLIKKYNNNNIEIIDCSKEAQNDKENIKKLINMIDNSKEKEVLLLRLGCINDKYYTEEEIAKILNINKNDVNATIKNGLSKIYSLSIDNQKQKTIIKN